MSNEWAKLPGDLLRKIDDRLILYNDKVRLRRVCKSWQSELSSPSLFQRPSLFLPAKLDGTCIEFFDITDSTTYYFDPITFCGSSHGWVVAAARSKKGGRKSVFMFNPLTGLKKQLPSISSSKGRRAIRKCVVSSNPSLTDDYMVVATLYDDRKSIIYTKCGGAKWKKIPTTDCVEDIIFYEGRLYCLTDYAQLMLVDIGASNPRLVQTIGHKAYYNDNWIYLADSRVGLLMVEQIKDEARVDITSRFSIYKFDFRAGQWSSNLTDIGDDMLFLGIQDAVSISLKDDPTPTGFKENNIRFLDVGDGLDNMVYVRECDLKTGMIEELQVFKLSRPVILLWFTPSPS